MAAGILPACHDGAPPIPKAAPSAMSDSASASALGGRDGRDGGCDAIQHPEKSELASVLWDPRFTEAKQLHYARDFRGEGAALREGISSKTSAPSPEDRCAISYAAGRAFVAADDSASAIAMFDEASHDNCPLASYAKVRGAQAKARSSGADTALALVNEASDAKLLEDDRKLVVADCTWEKGNRQDAAPLYRSWLTSNPHGQRWVDVALKVAEVDLTSAPTDERAKEAFDLATRVLTEAPKLESDKAEDLRRRAATARKMDASLSLEERARKARGYLDTGDPSKASELARSVIKDPHAKPAERCRAAMVRAGAEHAKPALFDAWNEAATLCDKSDEDLVTALYNGAKTAASLKRSPDALTRFAKVEEKFPNHRLADDARFRSALVMKASGDLAKYEATMASIVDTYPNGDMADEGLFLVALSHLVKGDDAGAKPSLEKIIDREKGLNRSWATGGRAPYFRARIAEREGKADDAKRAYTDVIASVPLGYYFWLARARLTAIDPDAAKNALALAEGKDDGTASTADALNASTPDASFALARRLLAVGEVDLAKRAMWPRVEETGERAFDGKVRIATVLRDGREWDDAIAFSRGKTSELYAHYPRGKWRAAWEVAYPRAFEDDVVRESGKNKIPAMLTWAIMREESSFMADVKSAANAFGLMQLIPPTAKLVAQGTSLPTDEASLKRPDVSIALGTKLLGQLNATEGHPLLAMAAYNGGGGAVRKWLNELPSTDIDLFVELIPWDETRGYVKRVTMSELVYAYLYDRSGFDDLAAMPLVVTR